MALTISINGTDVTNNYAGSNGVIEITDNINQPTTCTFSLTNFGMPIQILGGELVTIKDESQIYFDGIIPVEQGAGSQYNYLDSLAKPVEVYRKYIKVQAVDYQAVLDFVNQPNKQVYYMMSSGGIIKTLIETSPLRGLCDYDLSDGFVLSAYDVSNRKFSDIVQDLSGMNGFYFSITTSQLTPSRRFKIIFRSLNDTPAPFMLDRSATRYELNSLKFDPRQDALVNKITITGADVPSDAIQTDIYDCDGLSGSFNLTKVPYYLQPSQLLQSEFGTVLDPINNKAYKLIGSGMASGPSQNSVLQITGAAALIYQTPFATSNQRYTTWEDINLQNGADLIVGISDDASAGTVDKVKLGVHFKSNKKIMYIRDGEEITPTGDPTWQANTFYSARIKETSVGTYTEVQGGNLAPVRHWLPLQPAGTKSRGTVQWLLKTEDEPGGHGGRKHPQLKVGEKIWITVGDVTQPDILSLAPPPYTVTLADVSDGTLVTLHTNMQNWLNGCAHFWDWYYAALEQTAQAIVGVTNTAPIEITTDSAHNFSNLQRVNIELVKGVLSANGNGWQIIVTGPTTFQLVGSDGTSDGPFIPGNGTAIQKNPVLTINALQDGAGFNLALAAFTNSNALIPESTDLVDGTDSGAPFADNPSFFFPEVISNSGPAIISRIITRDPVGVEVTLVRAVPPALAMNAGDARDALADAQTQVVLTVGAADEVAEQYTAQVTMQGGAAVLQFFGDAGSLPQNGDTLIVAYRYTMPLRVTITDEASIAAVKARSKIPGDSGVREGVDVDMTNKVFSTDGAISYAQQYLALRSLMSLQGQVNTTTIHTGGGVPKTGQSLSIQMDGITRSEVLSQVITRHMVQNVFRTTCYFGKLPDSFLRPKENPTIRYGPDTLSYGMRTAYERLTFNDQIKIT